MPDATGHRACADALAAREYAVDVVAADTDPSGHPTIEVSVPEWRLRPRGGLPAGIAATVYDEPWSLGIAAMTRRAPGHVRVLIR